MSEILYRLWSNEHKAWWRTRAMGYTSNINEAGLFAEADATRFALQGALNGRVDKGDVIVAFYPATYEPVGES